MKKNILRTATFFFVLFPAIAVYLSYWQIFASEDLLNHPRNRRLVLNEKRVLRGSIFDRNGDKLAWSEFQAPTPTMPRRQVRKYFEAETFAHIIGYLSDRYGRAGIESQCNSQLSGMTHIQTWDDVRDFLLDADRRGHDTFLTIDSKVQVAAAEALRGRKGAVVAIIPATGEIVALVSVPGYDPAAIAGDWNTLNSNPDVPLFNRATMGLYPPGSTFKVITAGDALEEGIEKPESRFVCRGSVNIHGYDVRCPDGKAHGGLDLIKALVVSCNVTYAQVAVKLGKEKFQSYASRWGVGERLLDDLPSKASSLIRRDANLTTTVLAQSGFGQGEIVTTPLQMAVIAATIANGGLRMKPYLVQRLSSYGGEVLQDTKPTAVTQVISPDSARTLSKMMEAVVGKGSTHRIFGSLPYPVAGKTGTAQNPHGQSHAWFISFAPAPAPQIAVACIVENAGKGSVEAAPVVKKVIETALQDQTRTPLERDAN